MNLLDSFLTVVKGLVDDQGVYPHQCLWLDADGKLHCDSLLLSNPHEVLTQVFHRLMVDEAKELVFGLDRWAKEGQGVETQDILTVAHWKDEAWRYGVIEYRYNPPLFKDINWNIQFWNDIMEREINGFVRAITLNKDIVHKGIGKRHGTAEPSVN